MTTPHVLFGKYFFDIVGGNNSQIWVLGVSQKLYMLPDFVTLRFKGNNKNKLMMGWRRSFLFSTPIK